MDEKCPTEYKQYSRHSRVCSDHFVDKKPTAENPYPTEKLGYSEADVNRKRKIKIPANSIRSTRKKTDLPPSTSQSPSHVATQIVGLASMIKSVKTSDSPSPSSFGSPASMGNISSVGSPMLSPFSTPTTSRVSSYRSNKSTRPESNSILPYFIVYLLAIVAPYISYLLDIYTRVVQGEPENLVYHTRLLKNSNVRFYTYLPSMEMFEDLHRLLSPYVVRRCFIPRSKSQRLFDGTPKKSGPTRKLESRDELLLVLMKLRLGLLVKDLSDRFGISDSTCSKIFTSWIKAMSAVLRATIFIPDLGVVNATCPARFRKYNNLVTIIDCSEIFIQTPKDLELQSCTWSDYKHHNTLKFLVGVGPNSAINFLSDVYEGKASDKQITIESGLLDILPKYSTLMCDKGFNISHECAQKSIYLQVPPGRKGASQMLPHEVIQTNRIAADRILVEQVIRQMKCFRILSCELPITLLELVDDIVVVCAALTNLAQKPIYKD